MAAFATYSTTASVNVTFAGINIAENCPAANVNNVLRAIAAEGRQLYDIVNAISTTTLMPKAGGTFIGDINRSGAGGYLYNVSGAGGKVYVQLASASLPSAPVDGTFVFQY